MIKKVFFKNSKENKLCGILSNPASDKKRPMVLLCHGFKTSKESSTNTRLVKIFNEKKISTFRFDFFAHGESEGQFEKITIAEAEDDIICAISFLKKNGYSKLGLIGSSFGGMASLLAASKTENLFACALKSPVSDFIEIWKKRNRDKLINWKEKGFIEYTDSEQNQTKLNYTFYEEAMKVNVYETVKKIKKPVLIVHGGQDESVPVEQSQKTASLIPDCRLEIIEGADHKYSKPEDFEQMLGLISTFIIEKSLTH